MANFKYKMMALALAVGVFVPSISYAAEVVNYNATDLDQIFVEKGIDYDKAAVDRRKAEFLAKPNYIAPDIEVEKIIITEEVTTFDDGSVKVKETIDTVVTNQNKAPAYSKTPVYDRVVDISEHQDPNKMNYDKFAADVDGAILRTSIMDAKTLNIRTDYAVERHYKELNSRGVPLGFYHYSRAINAAEGRREAEYVASVIRNKKVSFPIYIDIEDDIRQAKASQGAVSEAAQSFIDTMNGYGYMSGIYSYPWFANKYLTKDVRNNNEFWIADYESKNFTAYKTTDFDSWQYAHTGRVNGYGGNIDMNILYRDYPYIITGVSHKPTSVLVDEVLAGKWGVGADRVKRLTYAGYNYDIVQAAVNARLGNI